MMEQHSLNIAESQRLLKICRSQLQLRECYQNISKIASQHMDMFLQKTWKIAYGYYTTCAQMPYILARHCYILDKNNQAIDPTILLHHDDADELKNWEYFDIKVFENYKDYLEALVSDKYYDLSKTLHPYDQQAILWSRQNGYWLLD